MSVITETDMEHGHKKGRRPSRMLHRGSGGSEEGQLNGWHSDDIIVTPFAQVLHTLLNARDNVVKLTSGNSPTAHINLGGSGQNSTDALSRDEKLSEDEYRDLASKTVEDIDWCLKQLEAIQTTRSVSDMASSKFKRLLTKELNSMAGTNRTSNQVSKYIETTFLDRDEDMTRSDDLPECVTVTSPTSVSPKVPEAQSHSEAVGETAPVGAKPTMTKVPIKLTHNNSFSGSISSAASNMPAFGVETQHEAELRNRIDKELDRWGMDIFACYELAAARPLTAIAYSVFERRGFMKKFSIPAKVLVNYFILVEDHYRSDIPYHNALHATDVLQSTHVLLSASALGPVFTDLDKLSCVFATAIHDVNHPGVTNQFLVNSKNELAIMYNDESVLENHHLAVAFRLLQEPDCDIFAGLSPRDHKALRKMVIDMVLATDMSKHMSLLADLKTIVETKKVQGKCVLKLDSYADKIKILQNLVHCADLSNPAKPLGLYRNWTDRIMEEFFRQGDREKVLGLEISPMCDRTSANIAASQVTFIDYIAHPLWEAWTELVHPDAEDILSVLEGNRDWCNEQLTPTPPPTATDPAAGDEAGEDPETPTIKVNQDSSSGGHS